MSLLDDIQRYLAGRLPAFLDDLEALVNRDCGTANKPGVDAVGHWVRLRLEKLAAQVEVRPQAKYGDLLLACWRGQGVGRVLLSAHLDTVYPAGTAEARPLTTDRDLVRGPGVCDMKGGLLAGLYAVEALLTLDFTDFGEIGYIFSSEEEVGSPASRPWLVELAPRYEAGLVLEPARINGDLVTGRKGGGFFELEIAGRAAHAGAEPEKGASAFLELAHQALALDAINGTIPGATLVIGVARAGKAANMVPDDAWASIDCRAVDSDSLAALDAGVRAATAHRHISGTTTALRGGPDRPPWPVTPAGEQLFALACRIANGLGFDVGAQQSGGTSDANFLFGAGLTCLDGLGPIGGASHTPDEWLLAPSIVPRTALVAGLIAALGRGELTQGD
ncbi:MAG: M20 family metallopeptidase [Ardenticatenaceae bacterium]|nr:M20 family metallopeptidase [Ardenticatenaceae bacterium]